MTNSPHRDPSPLRSPRPMAVQLTLTRAMVVSCVFQAIVVPLARFMRDGGAMFKITLSAAAIYWVSATWIMIRRRGRLAHGELMWLTIGFPLITIAIYLVNPLLQR